MDLRTEEDVKIHYLPGLLERAGYKLTRVAYDVPITVKHGRKTRTIRADAVVYEDDARKVPLLVVETKPPLSPVTEGDGEQGISYARLITPIAPVVLLTNGTAAGTKAFDTYTKKRDHAGLPTVVMATARAKKGASTDAVELKAEATHQIFKVDSVQEYKRILRASHNAIRNNEGYDPTKAFDELSKVMFCKLYEERRGQKNRFRVAEYDTMLANGVNIIRTIFEETKKAEKFRSLFLADSAIELSDRTIRELVSQFENYDLSLTDFDIKGEAFEHFLGDTFTGGLGQYFTPRNVVRFIVQALEPRIGQRVIDPFCGTGGFLINWHEVIEAEITALKVSDEKRRESLRELGEDCLFGIDWNERTSLACRMNMTVHGEGDSSRNIFKQSGFANVGADGSGGPIIADDMFDVCVTNPPFGSSESDPELLKLYELGAGRRSIERAALALERALKLVKPGGMVGIIVMDGILSNASMKYVRQYVLKHAWVRGLISLAPETFEAYGGRSDTTILLLEKKLAPDDDSTQSDVFMAICKNSGYAGNGAEVAGNELPGILTAYRAWCAGGPVTLENAWVGKLQDRLDPKFYWRQSTTQASSSTQDTVAELLGQLEGLEADAEGLEAQLQELAESMPYNVVPLGKLFDEVVDRHAVVPTTVYRLLGVRWWGAGAFVREVKKGSEIKTAAKLNKVSPGVLIYNRLFAFRGSFAVAGPECENGYTSVEFPTYQPKPKYKDPELLTRYVVHALNSSRYLPLIDAASSGSTKTSRNRFNQASFEQFEIAVPKKLMDMKRLVEILDAADAVRQRLSDAQEAASVMRSRLGELLPGPN
jgi:type I restriction enzyme M protein